MLDPCQIWDGSLNQKGYGRISIGGRYYYVHKLSYDEWYGQLPDGMEPDHLCRNRACFNPRHLEAVTHATNMARGGQASAPACARGHPKASEHWYVRKTYRRNGRGCCRTCKNEKTTEWKRRRAA